MSIRDDMIQKVLGNPGKYSIQQLQAAMQSGSLPAYVVVPIIQDKVQQQKQMQAAMQQQQPPQSTIAEQVMQEADQMGGVAQLPTNLPQEYAQGGIVAFDEGGEVKRFYQGGMEQEMGMASFETPENVRRPKTQQEIAEIVAAYQAQKIPLGRNDLEDIARGIKGMPPPPDTAPAAPAAKPPVAKPPAAGPGAGGFGGMSIADIFAKLPQPSKDEETAESLFEKQFGAGGAKYRERMEGIEAARKKEAETLRGTVQGEPYEEFKANLMKEAEQRGIDKQDAKNMAIFKAGLAMMAGTSRNALENIGKGAMVGAEDYQKAAADIKKAEKEHNRMLAHIEEARRAEKRGDVERRIAELDKASDRERSMEEFLSSGAYAAGVKKIDAQRDLFKNRLTVATQFAAAQMQTEARLDAALAKMVGRDQVTPQLKAQILSKIDENKLEQDALKALNLPGIPKSGKSYDLYTDKVNELRNKKLQEILATIGSGGGGGVGAAPKPAAAGGSGFKYLGQE